MARGKGVKRSAKGASKRPENEPKASITASTSSASSSTGRELEIVERLTTIGDFQRDRSTPAFKTAFQNKSNPKIFDTSATIGEVSVDLTARIETYISIKKCELLFAFYEWILTVKRNDAVDELLDISKSEAEAETKAADATVPAHDVPSTEGEAPRDSDATENAPGTKTKITRDAATQCEAKTMSEAETEAATAEKIKDLESHNQNLTLQLQEKIKDCNTLRSCCQMHHEVFQELKETYGDLKTEYNKRRDEYYEALNNGRELLRVYEGLQDLYREFAMYHGELDERYAELLVRFDRIWLLPFRYSWSSRLRE
ncbi:hypothetical protein BDW74DRAFT_182398 [Aspergillus multicolor]|uniref:uncharacterized protein n=1 Tax=Aspergillus multicolor TaxID=41759 RepID=UPI003CCCB9B4